MKVAFQNKILVFVLISYFLLPVGKNKQQQVFEVSFKLFKVIFNNIYDRCGDNFNHLYYCYITAESVLCTR